MMGFKRQKKSSGTLGTDFSQSTATHMERAADSHEPPSQSHDEDQAEPPSETAQAETESQDYPTGLKLTLILISLMTSMFLVALDRLIIATAIPRITDEFHSVTDLGWYGSAYLLTQCAFQLLFGKLYTFWNVKTVFLVSVALFEVGSAVCGAAPSSTVFIVGRAIAGVGGAGIFAGAIVILVHAVPLQRRPMFQGLFGAIFGTASVVGPVIGGAFTTRSTWRWCFYLNLPLGAVAMVSIVLLLEIQQQDIRTMKLLDKLKHLDFPGSTFFLPGTVCLILALEWGGVDHKWKDGSMIALVVLAGIFLMVFAAIQIYLPNTATVPPRIFIQRSVLSSFMVIFTTGAAMMIFVYFLPVWFQAIQGVSAVTSGIKLIPLVISMVFATGFSGFLITRIGYYTPLMLGGVVFMCVGAGLLTTLQVDTPQSKWVGYEILYGFGLGATFQTPNIAAQTVLPVKDVPVGTALVMFGQLLGGAVFIAVGQNVLNNQLLERLAPLSGFDPAHLKNIGATTLTAQLSGDEKAFAIREYNEALRKVFQVGAIMACLTVIGASFMEWKSVKKEKIRQDLERGTAKKEKEEETKAAGATPNNTSAVLHTDAATHSPHADEGKAEETETMTTEELEHVEKRGEKAETQTTDTEDLDKMSKKEDQA